jgi:hypothetical protein
MRQTTGEKMITPSLVVPYYNHLMTHCEKTRNDNEEHPLLDESDSHDAADHALGILEKYYNISSEHATLATVLDPRLKMGFYKDPTLSSDYGEKNTALC